MQVLSLAGEPVRGVLAVVSSFARWHWVSAQAPPVHLSDDSLQTGITSGADIGFRVEEVRGNTATGRLMVRVNGRWLQTQPSVTLVPLSQR